MAIRHRTKNISSRSGNKNNDTMGIMILIVAAILCSIGIKILFFTSLWDILQLLDNLTSLFR